MDVRKSKSLTDMSDSEQREKAVVENCHCDADLHGKQTEALRAAETRALEMIADGAKLSDVLNAFCGAIDDVASATTFL